MIFSAFSILVLSALEPNHIKLRFLALAVSAADIPAGAAADYHKVIHIT